MATTATEELGKRIAVLRADAVRFREDAAGAEARAAHDRQSAQERDGLADEYEQLIALARSSAR